MNNIHVFQTDVGILGYIILYGITLYNISDEDLLKAKIPEKDILVIKKVRMIYKGTILMCLS